MVSYLDHNNPLGMDQRNPRRANLYCIYTFQIEHHTMSCYNIGTHFHNHLHTDLVGMLFHNLHLKLYKNDEIRLKSRLVDSGVGKVQQIEGETILNSIIIRINN